MTTDQQPHTPLDDLVLRMHTHFGAANAVGDDYSADDFADVIRVLENMPAIEAAAEQRGEVEAIRQFARDYRSFYFSSNDQLQGHLEDRARMIEQENRADQEEDDDE